MSSLTSTYRLSNGYEIPIVGFNTWQTPDGDIAVSSVKETLAAGYRHIDTAQGYKDEESVGQAIRESGIPRKEIFLTTKLWNANHSYEFMISSFGRSLKKLQTDYVSLFLIHWPNPVAFHDNREQVSADTWRAFEGLCEAGRVRTVGMSNSLSHRLDILARTAKIMPVVNQVFLAPGELQPDVVEYAKKHEMILEAYSSLSTGKVFDVPEMKQIAEAHNKTIAQVVLHWSLQHGFLSLSESVILSRIKGNTELLDFESTEEEMEQIDQLDGVADGIRGPGTTQF